MITIFTTMTLTVFILTLIGSEFIQFSIYGLPIGDKKALEYISNKRQNALINSIDSEIISLSDKNIAYISSVMFPIFFKYYISDLGVVPRWSEAHKEIEKLYKELKEQ